MASGSQPRTSVDSGPRLSYSPKSSLRTLTPPASPTSASGSLPVEGASPSREWEFRVSVPIPQSKASALQILFSLIWGLWGVFASVAAVSFSLIFPSLFKARTLPPKTDVTLPTPTPTPHPPRPAPLHATSSSSTISSTSSEPRRVTFQLNQTNLLGLTETAEPEADDDGVTVINSPSSSEFPLKDHKEKERRRFSMPKLIKRKTGSPVSSSVGLPKISPAMKTVSLPAEKKEKEKSTPSVASTPVQRPRRLSLLFRRGAESESESPTPLPRRPRKPSNVNLTAASDTETMTERRVVSMPLTKKGSKRSGSKPPVSGPKVLDRHARMAASVPYRAGGWSDSER